MFLLNPMKKIGKNDDRQGNPYCPQQDAAHLILRLSMWSVFTENTILDNPVPDRAETPIRDYASSTSGTEIKPEALFKTVNGLSADFINLLCDQQIIF
jgi:hypothetical protein